MITTEHMQTIAAEIARNRKNYPSDAKHAHALGISTQQYSAIKNGKLDRILSVGNWVSIARRLGVHLRNTPEWKTVKTPTFQYIYAQLEACQRGSLSNMFCDLPDIGKTVTGRYYASQSPNAIYVDCGQVKSRQKLIRFIAREFGLSAIGSYATVYQDLVYYLRELPTPLIILDEAGDLEYEAYLELKALWNATEHYCGWYQMGATAFKQKIERGIERHKVG
jgi:DNA transposition AAA+ family ATPase